MIDRDLPPEQLVALSRTAEALGADDVWVVEDIGWGGGIAAAATVLATTSRVRVAVGIFPAPLRNPALLAMEIATLGRLHPGRFVAGIGHGVQEWMRQVGAAVPSPLALLEETFAVVRRLLSGERVTIAGRAVSIDDVALVHPPVVSVPLLAGVTGPKSLDLAGRIADGVVLVEGSGASEIRDAVARAANRTEPYEVVVLCHFFGSDDPQLVADAVDGVAVGFFGGRAREFTIAAGNAAQIADVIRGLWEAGATTVVLRPIDGLQAHFAHVIAVLSAQKRA